VIIISETLAIILGIAVGIFSAIRQYSVFDYLFTSVSFLGYAMPVFWFALLLQVLFVNIYLKWHVRIFYTSGLNTPGKGTWTHRPAAAHRAPDHDLAGDQLCALQADTCAHPCST